MPSNNLSPNSELPTILAGPILRHVAPDRLVLWVACSTASDIVVRYGKVGDDGHSQAFPLHHKGHVQVGEHAHIHLLDIIPDVPLPYDEWLEYDVGIAQAGELKWLQDLVPETLYEGELKPQFVLRSRVSEILHGSCRKPHHEGADGLALVDDLLQQSRAGKVPQPEAQPALLMLTGDQVYVDDVAGPMLAAIHQVIACLGLRQEVLTGAAVCSSDELIFDFYRRGDLLPDNEANATLRERFFAGANKPIFTTANADNHLISLAEVLALYLLVWSPSLWKNLQLQADQVDVPKEMRERYNNQLVAIEVFGQNLDKVQRALAHIPVYMIFDDHDVTDDWNLTRGWEESAYNHPFSRRIIGNALLAYLLCQGWGNAPDRFPPELTQTIRQFFLQPACITQDSVVDLLLGFHQWDFVLPTTPKVVVLDTRTRRWWSESSQAAPSGLMNWEALSDMQQHLIGLPAVILVSPAPIFGVKLIEVIQRIFTWFGQALMVDAENWMSHRGTANVILDIFRHSKTPHHFVILSGDVHYSFVYDVELRHFTQGPEIWQITSSGIKNDFPQRLLGVFDRLNRWLFASFSPLNWFTQRRAMRVRQRRPSQYSKRYPHQRLVNGSSIGRVLLDEQGVPTKIEIILAKEAESIEFLEGYQHDWL